MLVLSSIIVSLSVVLAPNAGVLGVETVDVVELEDNIDLMSKVEGLKVGVVVCVVGAALPKKTIGALVVDEVVVCVEPELPKGVNELVLVSD